MGIMGKEGRQAVNNSDYAIAQFRRAGRLGRGFSGRALRRQLEACTFLVGEVQHFTHTHTHAPLYAHQHSCVHPLHMNTPRAPFVVGRFLVPLLLVHGNLSYYRLARLIKYSFYKNISFAFVLFYYQFYNGFSGGCAWVVA